MNIKKAFICLLAALMLCASAFAAVNVVKPGDDFYYLDTANVLSQETEGEIFFCNKLLEAECGAQIVVAALDSIGNADIYDYAVEMGNSWGIGSADENNGFLLLMAIEEENYYALTSRGLDGIFPASELKKLYDQYLEKDFAAGRYDAGARKFFEAVFEKIVDYYNVDITVEDGVAAYQAYISGNNGTGFGGAVSGGSTVGDYEYSHNEGTSIVSLFSSVITIVVMLIVFKALFGGARHRRTGSAVWPFLFMNSHHHHHHHHRPPFRDNHRGPRGGGFGGGFGGGGDFSGGGFGGGRGGGGGGFGGGAGRGRH